MKMSDKLSLSDIAGAFSLFDAVETHWNIRLSTLRFSARGREEVRKRRRRRTSEPIQVKEDTLGQTRCFARWDNSELSRAGSVRRDVH